MRIPHIVGMGGTTSPGSSSERALRLALQCCAARGARWPTPLGIAVTSLMPVVGDRATVADPLVRQQIDTLARQVRKRAV